MSLYTVTADLAGIVSLCEEQGIAYRIEDEGRRLVVGGPIRLHSGCALIGPKSGERLTVVAAAIRTEKDAS